MKSARQLFAEQAQLEQRLRKLREDGRPRQASERTRYALLVAILDGDHYRVGKAISHLLMNPHLQSDDDKVFLRRLS